MKNILLLLSLILITNTAFAQLKPAHSQYLEEKGFLVNPNFEQGFKGWTITGCSKSLVTAIPFLNKSLKLTCVGESFSIKQDDAAHIALKGQQGIYDLQINATFQGTKVSFIGGGFRYSEINVNDTNGFSRIQDIPFTINGTSNGIEIYSDSIVTGEIIIDNIKLGLAPNGYLKEDFDDVPVGTVISYSSEVIPDSYLLADGACKSRASFASLYDVLGITVGTCDSGAGANSGFLIPDLRDTFLKGLTGGRVAFDTQLDATAKNGLTATTSSNTSSSAVSGGSHNHFQAFTYQGFGRYGSGDTGLASQRAEQGGVITNNIGALTSSNGSHGHTINSSTTSTTTINSSDSQTRPENKAVVYIIKALGRSPRTIVSQRSLAPDMAGFLTWAAFDGDVKGFLKADGACVSKTAYPDYFENVSNLYGDCDSGAGALSGVRLPDLVTGNRFPRMAGGGLAIGTAANDTTAINGISATQASHNHSGTTGIQNANHNHSAETKDGLGGFGFFAYGNGFSNGNVTTGIQNQNHGHAFTTNTKTPTITVQGGSSETAPNSMALIAYVRMENNNEINGEVKNTSKLGDCKWSVLDVLDFESTHTGNWQRLTGQSLSGTDLDTQFGITSFPNAVGSGAFPRMNGGLSGALRAVTADKTAKNGLTATQAAHNHSGTTESQNANHTHRQVYTSDFGGNLGNLGNANAGATIGTSTLEQTSANLQNHQHNYTTNSKTPTVTVGVGDNETAPNSIALNFYCLVSID